MIIKYRNPSWDWKELQVLSVNYSENKEVPKIETSKTHPLQSNQLTETKTSAVIVDITELIPKRDKTVLNSPYLDDLKPAFEYLKTKGINLSSLKENLHLFGSFGERMDQSTIQWIGKNYKRYRWLLGFTKKVEKGYMRLCDCFQLILLSFYTNHCSYKRTQRYLQECLFDPFVTKEMSSREIYTKPLRVQAEIKTTRYHLPNVCSYHAKLIVRLVLLLNNDSAIVKLICHVLYMMELLIKEKLLASQDFRKKYNEGEPDSAFEIEFKARWKYLLKLKNRKTMGGPNYFNITFKFCLQILSPLLEHLRNLGETDYSNIFQSKRYVQSELLMLKDKSFIAEFQILNWDKLLN